MSAVTTPIAHPPSAGPAFPAYFQRLRRFTRDEYHKMADAGILFSGEQVELLDGLIVEKPVKNLPHAGSTRRITNRLPKHLPTGWCYQVQDPVGMTQSEPEPDAAVLRGDDADYDTRVPEPADIGLAIEVADSSLRTDRREKGRLYAESGVPVYWIVNVADRQIEVYADPDPTASPPAYVTRTDYRPGQDVPIILDGQHVSSIPVSDLLP